MLFDRYSPQVEQAITAAEGYTVRRVWKIVLLGAVVGLVIIGCLLYSHVGGIAFPLGAFLGAVIAAMLEGLDARRTAIESLNLPRK